MLAAGTISFFGGRRLVMLPLIRPSVRFSRPAAWRCCVACLPWGRGDVYKRQRLAVVMQGVDNLFEVDTVAAVLHHVERISGKQDVYKRQVSAPPSPSICLAAQAKRAGPNSLCKKH